MNKKCPPGVICVENVTMFFFIIIILVIIYIFYNYMGKQAPISNNHQKIIIKEKNEERNGGNGWAGNGWGLFTRPNYGYTNLPGDVLMNPYMPPLRDERYLVSTGSIPINVSTNIGSVDTNYRQVGILTPLNGTSSNKILPLMGRPLFVNRDKWQYYTMSDQNNSVKLPISRNGRSCTNEYGCDKLYGGDTIYVEGYNQAFKITIYDNDTIKYIPFI